MRVIVTGAAGHLGRLVAEQLLERLEPEEVVLVTRRPDATMVQLDMSASDSGVRILLLDERGTVLHDTDNNTFAGSTFRSSM